MKTKLFWMALILAAGVAGWWLGAARSGGTGSSTATERRIAFYQSPMHPWIKSPVPGNCTICGMKLTPVYEGETPLEKGGAAMVKLNPRSLDVLDVATTEVRRQPLHRTLRVAGTIKEDDAAHQRLSAYVDGRIDKLMVRFNGAEVVAGQPLAHLYSPTLLTVRDEYLLLMRQAPSPQRDRMLEATRQRLVRLGLSQAQIDGLPQQKEGANYVEILAPISGTVVERNVYEGQYVKEGEVLFEIASFDQMWFVFDAYERDLAWIELGQMVEITTPAAPGEAFRSPINFIEPNLDPETRSARVRVVLDNPLIRGRRMLLAEMYAEGQVRVETPEVLAVPRSTVLSPGGEPIVYVAEADGAYSPRRVHLGRAGDDAWEVIEGLQAGEKIVATGNLLIDAQAQLDHGGTVHDHTESEHGNAHAIPADLAMPETEDERRAVSRLLGAVDALGRALAADNLNGYHAALESLKALQAGIAQRFPDVAEHFRLGKALQPAKDLAEARQAFHPFSKQVADFAQSLRKHTPGFEAVHVFECPMVKDAVPSAPGPKGRWVQLRPELQNPFFGAEMLECGTEVTR